MDKDPLCLRQRPSVEQPLTKQSEYFYDGADVGQATCQTIILTEHGLRLFCFNMALSCRGPVPEASSFQSSDLWVNSSHSQSCSALAAF